MAEERQKAGEAPRIGRAELLQGRDLRRDVWVKALEAWVTVQPLTEGQWAEVQQKKVQGQKVSGAPAIGPDGNPDPKKSAFNLEIDLAVSTGAEFEGDALAVYYGLPGDQDWTLEDVKAIRPAGAVAEIAAHIYEVSGVSKGQGDALQSFRGQRRGAKTGNA